MFLIERHDFDIVRIKVEKLKCKPSFFGDPKYYSLKLLLSMMILKPGLKLIYKDNQNLTLNVLNWFIKDT